MPTQYDPTILQMYADQLYRDAKWIVFTTALRYAIIVFVLALLALMALDPRARFAPFDTPNIVPVWVVTIGAFVVGADAGRRKAFRLKLEAQKILCNRQIELNTRIQNTSASAAKA
jgi:hypothetical protein